MGLLSSVVRRGRGAKTPPAEPAQSIDEVVAAHERACGPSSEPGPQVQVGALVARGKTLQALGDRVAIEPLAEFGKIGDLFVPTSQTFVRGVVVSHGSKVTKAKKETVVVISEFFGSEVKLEDGTKAGRRLRVGRERDIVGTLFVNNLTPVLDRILAVRLDPPKMAGLLHLPEDQLEKQFKARVISSGPDCTVEPGDVILVPRQAAATVNFGGAKMVLIDEPAVIAVLP